MAASTLRRLGSSSAMRMRRASAIPGRTLPQWARLGAILLCATVAPLLTSAPGEGRRVLLPRRAIGDTARHAQNNGLAGADPGRGGDELWRDRHQLGRQHRRVPGRGLPPAMRLEGALRPDREQRGAGLL